jgi:acyl-CoA thioester hydrolase
MNKIEIKIYYEDTDCGGVVYYGNYLRYMERGRTEYLADRGVSIKELMDQGTIFVVSRAEIDYKSSARYGDTIVLETAVAEKTGATLLFEHRLMEKTTGRLLVEGRIRMVCTDLTAKPKRIPKEMAERVP